MCDCSKVHLYEVEYKLEDMIVVPTHKNCGNGLNEGQAERLQKDLIKLWGFDDEEEE